MIQDIMRRCSYMQINVFPYYQKNIFISLFSRTFYAKAKSLMSCGIIRYSRNLFLTYCLTDLRDAQNDRYTNYMIDIYKIGWDLFKYMGKKLVGFFHAQRSTSPKKGLNSLNQYYKQPQWGTEKIDCTIPWSR